jgi:hypothetical protein
MVSGSRNTVNPLAVSALRGHGDSNPECYFLTVARNTSLVPSGYSLTIFVIKNPDPNKSSEMDPFGQYAGNIPSASEPSLRDHH